MSLESATFLNDLVSTNPVAGDNVSQGDDHLRLLKAVLKGTLPNLTRVYYLEQDRVDLASSTTPDLSTPASNYINITGTTQIDGFATEPAGFVRLLRFNAVLTLNYNATSLILPTGDDIITAAGDHAWAVSRGSGNWTVLGYERVSGVPVVPPLTYATALAQLGAGFGQITGIACASTTDLGTIATHYANVTGGGTITSFGSSANSSVPFYLVRFAAATTLTHGANLALPFSQSLVLQDNDHILMRYGGSGSWQVIGLFRNNSGGPTVQRFNTAGAGTYTTPAGLKYAKIRMPGGGGGGGAVGTNNGTAGGTTSFAGWSAVGGGGGLTNGGAGGTGGTGGTSGSGTVVLRLQGGNGAQGGNTSTAGITGSAGGANPLGGAGAGTTGTGGAARPNTGGGGAGGIQGGGNTGGGGAAGEYVEFIMTAAQLGTSQSYSVGAAGVGGAAGIFAGGDGGLGGITVEEFY